MKTQALITILLLLCTAIFSTEDTNNAPEYERKTWELNQLAERFKAETGFVGRINYGYERMRLGSFEGNFTGVSLPTEGDTIAFRQACEMIVDKILPFSPANRMQLSMSRISKSGRGYTTDYIQQVGGYRVEGAGFIMITSDSGRKHFSIGDNTVKLPDGSVNVMITREEAIEIYGENVDDQLQRRYSNFKPDFSIRYFNINKRNQGVKPLYRLCWVGGLSRKLVIDVNTGEIYVNEASILHDLTVNVKGSAYPDHRLVESVYDLTDTKVVAKCDGVPGIEFYTDSMGNARISGENIEDVRACLESYFITIYDGNTEDSLATQISEYLDDSLSHTIMFNRHNYVGNPSNQYYHANRFIDWASERMFDYPTAFPMIDVITGCRFPEENGFLRVQYVIKINELSGDYSSTICHELTHLFVYLTLTNEFMNSAGTGQQNEILYGCMDEAFSTYFPCSYLGDAVYQSMAQDSQDISDLITVESICEEYEPSQSVTEDFYSNYFCRYPLASAWWSLRGSSLFPNSDQGVVGVDSLLVAGLRIVKRDIEDNVSYRYKPRYFYNILMNLVADGSAPNTLNPKQAAIDNAYKSRGFHFTPQVISAGVSNPPDGRDKNMFRIGDPVHVKVTNCPQNTPLTVYIVEDQDYTDGLNISALNTIICQVSGTSDNDGVWYSSTPVMTASAVGDYDILVDIGNNGMLHFAYIGANVRDGFDGLNGPGFTVFDDGIDVVLTELYHLPFFWGKKRAISSIYSPG